MLDADRILETLRRSWSRQTSTKWTAANPALGQCSVTALVLQDSFGGRLLKTRIEGGWHFYNEIGGEVFDFTSSQFADAPSYQNESATREDALRDTSAQQYRQMSDAFAINWQKCG
jgi:hypothetical protein